MNYRYLTQEQWPSDAEYQYAPAPFFIFQYSVLGASKEHRRIHLMTGAAPEKTEDLMGPIFQSLKDMLWYHRVYFVAEPAARRYLLGHFDAAGGFATCGYDAVASKYDPVLSNVLKGFCQRAAAIDHTHSVFVRRALKFGDPNARPLYDQCGREVELMNIGAPLASRVAAILHAIADDPKHPDRPLWFERYEAEAPVGPGETKLATFYRMPPAINWTKTPRGSKQ